ncbi:unnamed protein product [Oikopleura dioica]|uniref:Uncharacterized protein n=1 Tax=Oikopleura dioica TaxID=34765 RepID=E4X5W8_OIKDI|nr:unnamed protein product [Oikopleura dioica]
MSIQEQQIAQQQQQQQVEPVELAYSERPTTSSQLPIDIGEEPVSSISFGDLLQREISEEASSALSAVSAELTAAQRAVVADEVARLDAARGDKLAELHTSITTDNFCLHLLTKTGKKYSLHGSKWQK